MTQNDRYPLRMLRPACEDLPHKGAIGGQRFDAGVQLGYKPFVGMAHAARLPVHKDL